MTECKPLSVNLEVEYQTFFKVCIINKIYICKVSKNILSKLYHKKTRAPDKNGY